MSTSTGPGPPGARDVEGLVDRPRDLPRVLDHERVLDDRHRDADRVGLLEAVGAEQLGAHLAGDEHDRHRVHHRVGDRRDQVRRAGAGRGERDADLAGRLGVALGGVAAAGLVAHEDVADAARRRTRRRSGGSRRRGGRRRRRRPPPSGIPSRHRPRASHRPPSVGSNSRKKPVYQRVFRAQRCDAAPLRRRRANRRSGRQAGHKGYEEPMPTPIASTIAPPTVTTSSDERIETSRKRLRTQAIANSSTATTAPGHDQRLVARRRSGTAACGTCRPAPSCRR